MQTTQCNTVHHSFAQCIIELYNTMYTVQCAETNI